MNTDFTPAIPALVMFTIAISTGFIASFFIWLHAKKANKEYLKNNPRNDK